MGFLRNSSYLSGLAFFALVSGLVPGQQAEKPKAPAQSRQSQQQSQDSPYVRLKLKNGNILEGRVLKESKDRILLQMGPGQTVDLPRDRILERKGLIRSKAAQQSTTNTVPGRDEWFLLHDAKGRSVGNLHVLLRSTPKGLHIEQQWTLYQAREKVLIHRIEECDKSFRPLSFQFREIVSQRSGEGFPRERLVRGRIQDETLFLEEADARGRTKRQLVFSSGTELPLTLKERLRRMGAGQKGTPLFEGPVFDTGDVVFEMRRYELQRGLPLAARFFGKKARTHNPPATRISWKEGGARHSEWVSREGRTLLIEASGVELVGEPINPGLGKALQQQSARKSLPRVFRVKGAELYAPDATWAFRLRGTAGTQAQILSPDGVTRAWSGWSRSPRANLRLEGIAELRLRNFLLSHEGWTQGKQRLVKRGRISIFETMVQDPKGEQAVLYFVPWEDGVLELGLQGPKGKALVALAGTWLGPLGSLQPPLAKPGR